MKNNETAVHVVVIVVRVVIVVVRVGVQGELWKIQRIFGMIEGLRRSSISRIYAAP